MGAGPRETNLNGEMFEVERWSRQHSLSLVITEIFQSYKIVKKNKELSFRLIKFTKRCLEGKAITGSQEPAVGCSV